MVLAVLIIAYVSGSLPIGKAKEAKKALCWVSPQNPSYIKEAPGKDPEGHDLVPVYATPAGEKPAAAPAVAAACRRAERKIKHWHCPMHPQIVREQARQVPYMRHGPGAGL